ncbi:hypothetical protein F9K78_11755 [Brucella pseudintermedia]|nr:hypothetical protein F9K78_11755 [Brucella pseudintermedia]
MHGLSRWWTIPPRSCPGFCGSCQTFREAVAARKLDLDFIGLKLDIRPKDRTVPTLTKALAPLYLSICSSHYPLQKANALLLEMPYSRRK